MQLAGDAVTERHTAVPLVSVDTQTVPSRNYATMAVYPAPLVTGSLPHPGTAADLAPSGTAAASAAEHTPSGAAPTAPAASASSMGKREDIHSYTRSFVLAHGRYWRSLLATFCNGLKSLTTLPKLGQMVTK